MHWTSALSENPALDEAIAECAVAIKNSVGGEALDLAVAFISPHYEDSYDRVAVLMAERLGGVNPGGVALTQGLSGGRSDFASFREVDVPYVMFFGDASRIHTDQDTIEFVQPEMLGGAAATAAALLQSPEFAELVANR